MTKKCAQRSSKVWDYSVEQLSISFDEASGRMTATIHLSHYKRLYAVLDAARSGNSELVKLALAHYDKFGYRDESKPEGK